MDFYCGLSKTFGWTVAEIDETYIDDLFDYVFALQDKAEEKGQYIDEVL